MSEFLFTVLHENLRKNIKNKYSFWLQDGTRFQTFIWIWSHDPNIVGNYIYPYWVKVNLFTSNWICNILYINHERRSNTVFGYKKGSNWKLKLEYGLTKDILYVIIFVDFVWKWVKPWNFGRVKKCWKWSFWENFQI